MKRGGRVAILTGSLAIWLVLGVANIYWSDLNQDEGWYLYAARSVARGMVPYQDFAFTQGPVFPFLYALGIPWIASEGVVAGRWITFALAGLTLIVTYGLAGRASPRELSPFASLIAFVLLSVNVYHSQFTTTVKTYALAALLLASGLLLVYRAVENRSRWWLGCVAGLLLALAAGTRLSIGIAIPVTCLYLLLSPAGRASRAWLSVGCGCALGLAVLYGPFLVVAREGLFFGLLEYHAGRSQGGLGSILLYKAGFVSRFVGSYFVACAAMAALALLVPGRGRSSTQPPGRNGKLGSGLLWWTATAISAVHISAPFPYDDYQVVIYPILSAAIGASLLHAIRTAGKTETPSAPESDRWVRWAILWVFLCSIASSFSSPVNQAWAVGERDRIWWRLKAESPLRSLNNAAAYVCDHTSPDEEILTQDAYLAVAANRSVPRGLELGPFSYFPEMSNDRADRLHVLNRDSLHELLRKAEAPVAAISGYGLAIRCPEVEEIESDERGKLWELLEDRYQFDHEIGHFGQDRTSLKLYRRKTAP